jgi:hypothetical protein
MSAKEPHFGWIDDFAAARNCSLSQCVMDIWFDSDYVLSPEDHNRILDLKRNFLRSCTTPRPTGAR